MPGRDISEFTIMLQDDAAAPAQPEGWAEPVATALLVLADGTVLEGFGIGATGEAAGEVCFNTAMTGYQEILTDPSYAGQIVTFTFPHIGNVGTNDEDLESLDAAPASGRAARVVIASRRHEPVELALLAPISTAGSRPAASSASPASTHGRSPR